MAKGRVENLKPPSTEEARERGKKGGQKSGEVRAKRKTLRETMEAALQGKYDGELTAMQQGINATIKKWIETGDISILNGIRDLIGEKPTDKIDASINSENKEIIKNYLEAAKNGKFTKID